MYEVHITDDFMVDGIKLFISQKIQDGGRLILHLGEDGYTNQWQRLEDSTVDVQPTLRLQGESARALLDALLRFYEGASDMHQVRSDHLHERERREKLEDKMTEFLDRLVKK